MSKIVPDYLAALPEQKSVRSNRAFGAATILQMVGFMCSMAFSVLLHNQLDSIDGEFLAILLGLPLVLGEVICAVVTWRAVLQSDRQSDRTFKWFMGAVVVVSLAVPLVLIAICFLRPGPKRGSIF